MRKGWERKEWGILKCFRVPTSFCTQNMRRFLAQWQGNSRTWNGDSGLLCNEQRFKHEILHKSIDQIINLVANKNRIVWFFHGKSFIQRRIDKVLIGWRYREREKERLLLWASDLNVENTWWNRFMLNCKQYCIEYNGGWRFSSTYLLLYENRTLHLSKWKVDDKEWLDEKENSERRKRWRLHLLQLFSKANFILTSISIPVSSLLLFPSTHSTSSLFIIISRPAPISLLSFCF